MESEGLHSGSPSVNLGLNFLFVKQKQCLKTRDSVESRNSSDDDNDDNDSCTLFLTQFLWRET